MTKVITLENAKGYKTAKNLQKALERTGLANIDGCRCIVCNKEDGTFTAIFLVSEYMNKNGGYAGFAAEAGFVSV